MSAARWFGLVALAAAQLGVASLADAQRELRFSGTLPTSTGGPDAPRGVHTFEAGVGQRVEVRVTSDAFDTVLELTTPQGDTLTNDDTGESTNSMLSTYGSRAGTWRVQVTAYDTTGGPYDVLVTLGAIGNVRELPAGALTSGDAVSVKGVSYDSLSVRLERPVELLAELSSTSFTPTLMLVGPTGERFVGEASSGSTARIEVPFAQAGSWRVIAAQSSPDDQGGPYTLRLIETPVDGSSQVIAGALEARDPVDLRGEHYDTHSVSGSTGTRQMLLELSSTDFDAYLSARSPSGVWYRDDDGGASGSDARLEVPAEAGSWTVIVTSFGEGETGQYRLRVVR